MASTTSDMILIPQYQAPASRRRGQPESLKTELYKHSTNGIVSFFSKCRVRMHFENRNTKGGKVGQTHSLSRTPKEIYILEEVK